MIDLEAKILKMPKDMFYFFENSETDLDTIRHRTLKERDIVKQRDVKAWKHLTVLSNERLHL